MTGFVVLDASALLVLLKREPGADIVRSYIEKSFISAVNYAEVLSVLMKQISIEEADKILMEIDVELIDFTYAQGYCAAAMIHKTARLGLSLGDRACLALAKIKNVPAITADRSWSKLDIDVEIRLVR
jgi:PIN domain nuclease of toxin-antitoxin system